MNMTQAVFKMMQFFGARACGVTMHRAFGCHAVRTKRKVHYLCMAPNATPLRHLQTKKSLVRFAVCFFNGPFRSASRSRPACVSYSTSAAGDVMTQSLHTALPDGRFVIVSAVKQEELSDVYKMVREAARTNDGFGFDMYPSEEHFRAKTEDGKIFEIRMQDSCKLVAVLLITKSKFYRGQCFSVADVHTHLKLDEVGKASGLREFCANLATELCRMLDYTAIYADTFSTNVAMRKTLENCGYQRVGVLPMGGTLKNGRVVSSFIYYLDLRALGGNQDASKNKIVLRPGHTGTSTLTARKS